MIPVRRSNGSPEPDLSPLVLDALGHVEAGLSVVLTDVPLDASERVDAVAVDVVGRPTLVLVEQEDADAVFERAARAILAWRRVAHLLGRVLTPLGGPEDEAPRLVVVGRRFSERTGALLGLLDVPAVSIVEGAVIDGPENRRFVVTGRVPVPRASRPAPPVTAAESAADRPAPARARGRARDGMRRLDDVDHFEQIKQRVLRLSPDVIEEEDGDLLGFRVAGQLLATVRRRGEAVAVRIGDGDEPELLVEDLRGLHEAMDMVFERFFGMSSTRHRVAMASRRAEREAAAAPREVDEVTGIDENGRAAPIGKRRESDHGGR